MIKRILVGLAGEPYTTGETQHAIELARLHEAELTAVSIVDTARLSRVGPAPIGGGGAARELAQYRIEKAQELVRKELESFDRACREVGIQPILRPETGDPFQLLIARWRYHDLTILSLQKLFEHGIVDEPTDGVLRLIAAGVSPILAVSGEYRPVERVLIAYNGSLASARAMKRFVDSKLWPQAKIRIAIFRPSQEDPKTLSQDAQRFCSTHGYEVDAKLFEEEPAPGLLRYSAEWKAGLIVMGCSTKSFLTRLLLSGTALKVVRESDRPVFLSH